MKKSSIIVIFLIFIMVWFTPCCSKASELKNLENFSSTMRKWSSVYRKADISEAEKITSDTIKTIYDYKKEGVQGIDYSDLLAFMYGRLYLIEIEKGQKENATYYLNKSFEVFTMSLQMTDKELKTGKLKLIEFLIKLDCKNGVKWLNCENYSTKTP